LVLGDADCSVEIKRPFDGRQQELTEELQASIKQAVAAMDLPSKKGTLLFRVSSTTAGEEVVQKLFDSREPIVIPPNASPALRDVLEQQAAKFQSSAGRSLAVALGFDAIRCSHSPNGGAPEKLVGQAAPDFQLQTLDGQELDLHSFRNDRPALVTFWGVACGPCCAEAPHLTTMHEKHAADFAILAVNAYDETQKVVSRYAEQTKLTHPIVLHGGSVAQDLYHVAAYPTTFWINRDGIVADYDIGFDSAKDLETRIDEMLEQQQQE
jgi:thiol-disulfide isomerase/thioredoxin